MLIWDYIRDFLVQNIFGGIATDGMMYSGYLGFDGFKGVTISNVDVYTDSGFVDDLGEPFMISMGDWLSTTATIILMCLIVVLFVLLVRWVFKTVVSAFLLK